MTSSAPMTPPMSRAHTIADTDRVSKKSPTARHNEARSNRNTKVWSSEDERILLQGRLERITYRQIGARLGKSDLACRLHFHQMVMAKKTPEAQPWRSIVFLSSEHPPEVHRLAPSTLDSSSLNRCRSPSASYYPPTENFNLSLPQVSETGHRGLSSYPRMDNGPQLCAWQPVASPYASYHQSIHERGSVDLGQLKNIYDDHANDFWSTIAAKYSGMDRWTPIELEHAFFSGIAADEAFAADPMGSASQSQSMTSLLPRSPSPSLIHLGHDRHSNVAIVGKCSVESLLNHKV